MFALKSYVNLAQPRIDTRNEIGRGLNDKTGTADDRETTGGIVNITRRGVELLGSQAGCLETIHLLTDLLIEPTRFFSRASRQLDLLPFDSRRFFPTFLRIFYATRSLDRLADISVEFSAEQYLGLEI